ncbi:ABC transporter permease [Galbibacter sp. EGI 63066]|uniref:ABC transporter permease n=1 Tax=Galbibacter sp. EGI 63066 TaxID=2993559 RepID=UPI002248BDBE|nr:ABC transporter permease [Galbibacter sp. EGI 63066]MCX2681741.1 ABC transporter permease [Galbibacter sp. EGI 63066]
MIRNYFKIAWRSLKGQPFFTFLNTFGLAIGMAGGLLVSLYIYDEFSYDRMFVDADRIYRINADLKFGGDTRNFAVVTAPMADAVKSDIPEIETTTRFRTVGTMLLKKTGSVVNVKETHATYVDSTFFSMFGIDLLVGDPNTALKDPHTLILTKTAAKKHFDIDNALGQTLVLNNGDTYTVTGVIDDFPKNSFLRDYGVFMSMAGYGDAWVPNWGGNNFQTYIKLIPGTSANDIQERLQAIVGRYVIPGIQEVFPGITEKQLIASGSYLNFSTIALKDIRLHSDRSAEISPNNSIQNIYILSFIALFLIVLASVNFMNLSTAGSLKRAKEVGIRKTLGSNKAALRVQFLMESGLIALGSMVLAIVIASVAMPFFNQLSGKSLSIPFTDPLFWSVVVLATALLGLISGSYPAFFMSRFVPVKVLKGSGSSNAGGAGVRNALVVFQFAISVFLIISTLVVYQQLRFIQSKDLGFSKDQVLLINDAYAAGDQAQSFKRQVKQLRAVQNASLSSFYPTPSNRSDESFNREGALGAEHSISMQDWEVDYDYVSVMGLKIIAGRDFDRAFGTDSTAIIINEAALKLFGVGPEEAIGLRVTKVLEEGNTSFSTVIGVVKNFHFRSLRDNIGALSMSLGDFANGMAVKLSAGDFTNTISQIEAIWKEVAPGQPFSYNFMDEAFNNTYQSERRLGKIFIVFTILSLLIACLGLFGLAIFNAEKRIKEIGVRKVLGASVGQISYRLTTDFLKLVGVAIVVSLPIGWYVMNKWLEDFTYRTEIGWWVLVMAAIMAIIIAILTVGYQSIKAAIQNPVKSLRTE